VALECGKESQIKFEELTQLRLSINCKKEDTAYIKRIVRELRMILKDLSFEALEDDAFIFKPVDQYHVSVFAVNVTGNHTAKGAKIEEVMADVLQTFDHALFGSAKNESRITINFDVHQLAANLTLVALGLDEIWSESE
jgi:hypothetical protein